MHPKQVRAITRCPKATMRHLMTGEVPKLVVPRSPLITLLEKYSPRDRLHMIGVKLTHTLGYSGGMTFRNAEQLYTWLKPASHMLESEYWPAESRRIKSFQKSLTERDLAQSCAQWPQWLEPNLKPESATQHGKGAA